MYLQLKLGLEMSPERFVKGEGERLYSRSSPVFAEEPKAVA